MKASLSPAATWRRSPTVAVCSASFQLCTDAPVFTCASQPPACWVSVLSSFRVGILSTEPWNLLSKWPICIRVPQGSNNCIVYESCIPSSCSYFCLPVETNFEFTFVVFVVCFGFLSLLFLCVTGIKVLHPWAVSPARFSVLLMNCSSIHLCISEQCV